MFGLFKYRQKNVKKQIRPLTLQDFIGQENAKLILNVALNGAKQRGSKLEHIIVYGPPGLGKTTLANIIAAEMRSKLHMSIGTSIQTSTDVVDLFEDVFEGDIVFIDEIHRIPVKLEELLYTAMEDGYIDLGNERMDLPSFTLIGATTRLGNLSKPLRDRFGIQLRLELYSQDELVQIALRTASMLGITLTYDGALILASRARGTPRVLNNFIRRAMDVAHASGQASIDETVALATLEMLEIDELGLGRMDRKILDVMINDYNCKPVGLNTLAISVGECAKTIQEVYEPYLIASKLIQPTSRGRVVTQRAINYIRGCKI
jgi:Holliday junction DNA helicase RuvB